MALIAEVDVTLDLPFGAVDYSLLDEVISEALRAHRLPVLSVEVQSLRPVDAPVDPGVVQTPSGDPFSPQPSTPLGPPGPFGTRI